MLVLYTFLQDNDQFYINAHIQNSPEIVPFYTGKTRPDFGPACFGISNSTQPLLLKGNFHLAAWKISKSLCSARFERD